MKFLPVVFVTLAITATGFAIPHRSFSDGTQERIEAPKPIAISIDDLAVPIKSRSEFQESKIPKKILELNGKRVRLIGQMYFPVIPAVEMKEFVFNGDTEQKTCNGFTSRSAIPLQHMIKVQMKDGAAIKSTTGTIEVIGRLRVKVERSKNEILFIYKIEDATVRPGEREEGFQPSLLSLPIITC